MEVRLRSHCPARPGGLNGPADDERCHNVSRRHRGMGWFLGILFASTTIVCVQLDPVRGSTKAVIVVNLGTMGHQSLCPRPLSD